MIVFLVSFLYSFAAFRLYTAGIIKGMWVYYLVGYLLLYAAYRSHGPGFETIMALVLPWLFKSYVSSYIIFYLILFTIILVFTAYRVRSIITIPFVLAGSGLWVVEFFMRSGRRITGMDMFLLLLTVFTLIKFLIDVSRKDAALPKKIDVLLCSYSSNTAHYTYKFIEGLESAGKKVNVFRQHYYESFDPEFTGDALVIAYPVYGWKPPWPTVMHILKRLPRGNGKPVFLLYTAAGGPENAGAIAWFLLALKGYRVMGRNWAAYPLNVVTFRLGPKIMWKYLDRVFPAKSDVESVKTSGIEFAEGKYTGMPMIFWQTPLVLIGFLLENKYINRYIYKTYPWKRRCTKCMICVNYCPSHRFTLKEGFPRSSGDCALCLSCINLCPERSMNMVALSEYGNPYTPRWPEYLIKPEKRKFAE